MLNRSAAPFNAGPSLNTSVSLPSISIDHAGYTLDDASEGVNGGGGGSVSATGKDLTEVRLWLQNDIRLPFSVVNEYISILTGACARLNTSEREE